ncbi:Polyadenylate-binding protein 7, partial [Mucuna pruriens]
MQACVTVVLALATVVEVATVACGGLAGTLLPLERAIPLNQRVELEALRARDRARHGRILQGGVSGIVDFSVQGTSDPYFAGLYFTKVKLGSPAKEFYVQIDTGSDILWLNCITCSNCPQSSGLGIELNFFDTAGSSSAALVSCTDPICSYAVQTATSECYSQTNQCSYTFQYGDGSGTSGYYVSDTMSFDSILGQNVVSNSSSSVVFGCSTYQSGDLTKTEKAIDGIFGFGPGALSVISQLSSRGVTPNVFSHCLKGEDNGGGVLVLGEILEPNIVYSPLVPSQPHYNLNLQSIAVNGRLLSIDSDVFATANNRGTIVDSGTTLAYLVQEAFDPFVTAITAAVSQFSKPIISKGNQCYLVSNSVGEIFPQVSLNFMGGASMVLNPEHYLMHYGFLDGAALWCIGFQKVEEGFTILGGSLAVNVSMATSKSRDAYSAGQIGVSCSHKGTFSKLLAIGITVSSMAVPPSVAAAPASLYVGDLHPDVSDGHLVDAFSDFKSLASVRVCRDSATGKSLCYGYVNFASHQDAIRAIELKNHSTLNGKVIRVMWSRRDPDVRKSTIGNLFVKNLPELIDNAGLQDIFKKYGNILSSKVVISDDGKSKGYGFVQFESEESSNVAIEKLNGSIFGDKQLYVGKFVKKSDRILPGPNARYTNLYMKNLDLDITEATLQEKFAAFGKIVSLAIAKDNNGMSKGFGFVNYDNPDGAKKAMEAMNGSQLGSKILYVARAQKKAEREQILHHQFEEKRNEQVLKYKGSNIYVKNIDDNVSDEGLRDHFSACGTITSAKVMRDDKGISKGFGFVCFSTPEEANKAVNTFHGFMFHGKPLYVALAQRKEDRKAQLQLQYAQQIAGLAGPSTAIIPGGYPPYYYAATGVISHVPPRAGLMYQHLALRPGWGANGFVPPARSFQQSPVPAVSNNTRQQRQNRGRLNGLSVTQGNTLSGTYLQQPQPISQSVIASRESSTQQRTGQAKYIPSIRQRDMEKGSGSSSGGSISGGSQGSEMLHSMLAGAAPEQQKEILGEHLYMLPSLAAKITGMLLEMDNGELLLLLESPESLSAKVEEAVQVLKNSKTKVSGQDVLHSNFLSAE